MEESANVPSCPWRRANDARPRFQWASGCHWQDTRAATTSDKVRVHVFNGKIRWASSCRQVTCWRWRLSKSTADAAVSRLSNITAVTHPNPKFLPPDQSTQLYYTVSYSTYEPHFVFLDSMTGFAGVFDFTTGSVPFTTSTSSSPPCPNSFTLDLSTLYMYIW